MFNSWHRSAIHSFCLTLSLYPFPSFTTVPSTQSLVCIGRSCTGSWMTVNKGLMPHPATGHNPQPFLMIFHFTINLTLQLHFLNRPSPYLLTPWCSPFWAANWFATSQEIPRISRYPKVHYRTHKRPPPGPAQSIPYTHIPYQKYVFLIYISNPSHSLSFHWTVLTNHLPTYPPTWGILLLQKLPVRHLIKKSLQFVKFSHYHVCNSLPFIPMLTWINPVHTLPTHSSKINFNTKFPSMLRSSKLLLSFMSSY